MAYTRFNNLVYHTSKKYRLERKDVFRMKCFLKMDVCIGEKRLCADEPMDLEEYAALVQLLEKFSNKRASLVDKMQVSKVLAMVKVEATREVK